MIKPFLLHSCSIKALFITAFQVADALAEELQLRGNSTSEGMENRRDKRVQQEAVRLAGRRSVRSACGKAFKEVLPFVESEKCPLIVKPVESAGSDGVKKCETKDASKKRIGDVGRAKREAGVRSRLSHLVVPKRVV